MDKYIDFLMDRIHETTDLNKTQIDIDVDVFESNYMDSLSLFGLLVDIENEFNISLDASDIMDNSARTIKGLAKIIENKCL